MRRGKIHKDPYIVCGICEREQLGLYPVRPADEARELGWKYTREHGWICPGCVASKK